MIPPTFLQQIPNPLLTQPLGLQKRRGGTLQSSPVMAQGQKHQQADWKLSPTRTSAAKQISGRRREYKRGELQ
jgi:hypothetical protein